MATLKARPASPVGPDVAAGFDATTTGFKPRFAPGDFSVESAPARVTLPTLANAALHLEDAGTGTAVDVSLRGAAAVAGQATGGYVVYPGAAAAAASVVQRALVSGAEDFFAFDAKPAATQVGYDVALGLSAAGLRLVGGALEVLDAGGVPRLRVAPPYVVGADGARTDAVLSVVGCVVDTNPAPPWGRAVTAPGASTCQVQVAWPATGVVYPAILDPRWTTTGSMGTARQDHTMTLLANGKVLVTGGRSTTGTTGLATAELYDRTTGTWSSTASMAAGRFLHRATQLNTGSNSTTSGKVLISGGINGTTSLSTFQLYDPAAGTWSSSGNMNAARHGHTATLLADGKVLAAGGLNGTTVLATAAIYNPASGTGSWAATTGPLPPTGQTNHTAVLLQTSNQQLNNKVLLVGGNSGSTTLSAVYLFDPAQSAFSTLQAMPAAREMHTMTVLAGGKVLVTGGKNGSTTLNTAAIFDPGSGPGSWSTAGTMTSARWGHTATLLPASIVANGQVLVAGGNNGSGALSSAELFSGTSTWTSTPAMPAAVQGHTAVLLGNNMVLTCGGLNGSTVQTAARLYDASFGLGCSSASQCPTGNCVNGVCCDTACNGGCGACNLAGSLGTCTALASGTTCRASVGTCDVAETCSGSSLNCPADGFAPSTTVCRAAAGECDVAENCTGSSATCPSDSKKASGTACTDDGNACTTDTCNGSSVACQHPAGNPGATCRAAAGECDLAETCTGSSATCPSDSKKASGTACTDDGNVCTTDTCNGSSVACQHPAGHAGVVCRAVAGVCDLQETCTGGSTACPADTFKPSSTSCRVSAGACDVAESCTGTSAACPADGFASPDTICRASTGASDLAESCSGASATCPPDGSVQEPTPQPEPGVGQEFNGTLAGQLGVTPSGAATFTVPIAVPPGIAGIAPNLSLAYNSQSGDGIAGQGWELAGLSMIHRCPKSRVQDGVARQVTMRDLLEGDGVCLDGKRLFESSTEPGKYESEVKDFSTITRVTTPPFTTGVDYSNSVSFTVVTKTGETRYYGARDTADTRVVLDDEGSSINGDREIAIWLLDRVVDAWGNYFDVHYNEDQADFEANGIRVTRIDYTGHLFGFPVDDAGNPTGTSESQNPFHSITFAYEDRPDVRHIRFHGSTLPRKHRLTSITTPLGTYSLDYDPYDVTLPSRLKRIHYCTTHQPIPPPPALPTVTCLDPLEFDWDAGGYRWEEVSPSFAPPVGIDGFFLSAQEYGSRNGTQFVDLDGDGRVDFITSKQGSADGAWLNTDQGWVSKAGWVLPAKLFKSDFHAAGTFLADIDGDGLADLISAPSTGTSCVPAAGKQLCVWLNRIKQNPQCAAGACWLRDDARASVPASWGTMNLDPSAHRDMLGDFDGDGKVDIARAGPGDYEFHVILSTPTGWVEATLNYNFPYQSRFYHLEDINRDGLVDVVINNIPGSPESFLSVGINTGKQSLTEPAFRFTFLGADPKADVGSGHRRLGDVDGDGYYDSVWNVDDSDRGVALATGTGYATGGIAAGYASTVPSVFQDAGGFAMVDVNADGLADSVESHLNPAPQFPGLAGAIKINSGTTWIDPGWFENGPSDHVVPVSPANPSYGAEFVDIDGDGVTDLVQSLDLDANDHVRHAWLNRFRPPVITKFPNGLARKTEVAYAVITTAAAVAQGTYIDDFPLATRTTYMTPPARVVASVAAENGLGVGNLSTTTYQYHSMRGSADGRGPQGFARIEVTDPANITTRTDYAQAHPYTGMPLAVLRYYNLGGRPPTGTMVKLTETHNDYCNTIVEDQSGQPQCTFAAAPPSTAVLAYPLRVTDTSYLLVGPIANLATPEVLTATSEFRYDALGNPIRTTVTTVASGSAGETYEKKTENTFGADGSDEQRLGKVTRSVVTSRRITPSGLPPIVHTTEFDYGTVNKFFVLDSNGQNQEHDTLGLKKKRVEPGAGLSIELHSAFQYDRFGDVTGTTDCASDFGACAVGQAGPADLPFRTSRASYDPADFNSPTGPGLVSTLGYTEKGRFPVKATNAVGHAEYSAYDPIKGVLLQKTGPNGIHTCYGYTDLGRQTSITEFCGSASPAISTTNQYRTTTADPAIARIVTVTRPPTGAASWVYTNVLGRKIDTRTRSFDGGFTQVTTSYDFLGRVWSETAPHLLGGSTFSTTVQYDEIGRPTLSTQQLGDIDATGTLAVGTKSTSYLGMTTHTERARTNEQGQLEVQTRDERKNGIGKVASVTDAMGVTISYAYDADGNLTDTTDPSSNVVHVHYDRRGRKDSSADPDLGTWTYAYDGFGDLTAQTDAKNQTTTMAYDRLGRLISKTDASGTAEWVYDVAPGAGIGKLAAMVSAPDARLSAPCTIPGTTGSGGNRTGRWFTYTASGDVENEAQCIDGETFLTTHVYDAVGRLSVLWYPDVKGNRLAVGYRYTSLGFLHFLTDASTNSLFWRAVGMNAMGQVTDEVARNGVETLSTRNPVTGWLLANQSTAHADGDSLIQSRTYQFDEMGNLKGRGRFDAASGAPSNESFTYDALNRLKSARVQIVSQPAYDSSETYDYDSLGNITQKSGKIYTYGGCSAGPHAVCTVGGGPSYVYDLNGNVLTGENRTVTYDSRNKPTRIESEPAVSQGNDTGVAEFIYAADGNRVVQTISPPSGTVGRTLYVGLGDTGKSLYERTTRGATVEHAEFIYAGGSHGGSAFAIRIVTDDGSPTPAIATKYYHVDHLGSVTAMSDERGRVVGVATGAADATVLGYDAWGARRRPDGHPASPASFNQQPGRREFTGHETIQNVGLVNMNGRIYDPVIGRFLSPDPHVQFVDNLQGFNRYSYVQNNPLRYSDPTGYFLGHHFDSKWDWLTGDFLRVRSQRPEMLAIEAIAIGACATGGGCVVGGLMLTAINTSVAVNQGASWGQVALTAGIGITAGVIGGSIAGGVIGVGEETGRKVATQILAGAIAGGITGAVTTAAFGGDLGENVIRGAHMGAIGGALTWAVSSLAPVSQAAAAEAQGDGGSGATQMEHTATASASGGATESEMIPASLRDDAADLVQGAKDRLSCALSAACREAIKNAMGVDLATDEGKAVFWSGGARAEKAAELYAEQTGGYTIKMKLESTAQGRELLDQIEQLKTTGQQREVWRVASGRFAFGASGNVQAFISPQANPNSLFFRIEQPILNVKEFFGTAHVLYNVTPDLPLPQPRPFMRGI